MKIVAVMWMWTLSLLLTSLAQVRLRSDVLWVLHTVQRCTLSHRLLLPAVESNSPIHRYLRHCRDKYESR